MEIRPATADDVEAIAGVARASWAADYPDIVSRESATETVEEWYAPERIRSAVEASGTLVLVADDGEVIGFSHAALSTERWTGSILRIYVHPDHRREGTGSKLLDETIAALLDRDVERVEAMVLADNEQGNEFYRAEGFVLDDSGETRIAGELYDENRYVYEG